MAEITAQTVNEFRKETGLGLMECKALLKEADGDPNKAKALAKAKHGKNAENRAGRATKAGRDRGLHPPRRQAGGDGRGQLRDRLRRPQRRVPPALPRTWPSTSSAPTRSSSAARTCRPISSRRRSRLFEAEVGEQARGHPREDRRGQALAWAGENAVLLDQPFVKDDAKTIRQLVQEVNARTGENITVGRFARFIVGEDAAPAEAKD